MRQSVLVGGQRRELTKADKQALRAILAKIKAKEAEVSAARDELAVFAESHGQRAVAEEMGVTQQAISLLIASRGLKPKKSAKPRT